MALRPETKQIILDGCTDLRIGNRSAWRLLGNRFFKLWPGRAPGHSLLLSPTYKRLAEIGMVARLEEHGEIKCHVRGRELGYGYVYSKLDAEQLTAEQVLQAIPRSDWWVDQLYLFFKQIQKAGFLYFDIDWRNFGKFRSLDKLVFFDVDSAQPMDKTRLRLHQGNQDFHTLFYALQQAFGEKIEIFNVAVLSEIYIATVFAYLRNDSRVLEANQYGANSYYRDRKVRVPFALPTGEREIVEEYLKHIIETCESVMNEKFSLDEAFDKLRARTSQILKALRSQKLVRLVSVDFAEIEALRDEGKWRKALEKLGQLTQRQIQALEELSKLNLGYMNVEALRKSVEESKSAMELKLIVGTLFGYMVVGGLVGHLVFYDPHYNSLGVGALLGMVLGPAFAALYINTSGGEEGKVTDYVIGALFLPLLIIALVIQLVVWLIKILLS